VLLNQAEVVEALRADGWRGGGFTPNDDYVRRLYRFYKTPTHCACNADKPGIQLECAVWEFPDGCGAKIYIELVAETPDGKWPKIQIGCDSLEDMENQIPRLLAAWELIANWDDCQRLDGRE